jgi:methionyl-tRNA formyltransferase
VSLTVVFAGTPEFAVPTLQALLDSDHTVPCVYTQPDRPAGRGRKLTPSPVKRLAGANAIEVRQPLSLRDPQAQADLAGLAADVMVVAAYGLILPAAVLEIPQMGCINVHASLLPRWRGASPIQSAILAGDRQTGISIMQMDEGLDTGAVLLRRELDILPAQTAGRLHDRLARLGAQALLEALAGIEAGTARAEPQDDALATYAPKLSKDQAPLDWHGDAQALARQVWAFNPWPVAQTTLEGQVMRIWMAHPLAEKPSAPPGTVLHAGHSGIDVACGQGRLRLTEVQLPGRRAMAAAELVNAVDLAGCVLGGPPCR